MSDIRTEIPVTQTNTGCNCGHAQDSSDPVLDARAIPHAIRHAAIFGALDSLDVGSALVILAPHEPIPLLAQVQERYNGRVTAESKELGPEEWRVRLARSS